MDMLRGIATEADENARWAFIVGAPRCGTTSLSRYLQKHPDVSFARIKEPHFFSQMDLRPLPDERLREVVREQYLERYFPERTGSSLLAEGSVTYFYFPERLEPILRLWPKAKFIVSLRNPLQMIPSLHQRLFFNGDETERQFRRAWDLVPRRREGRSVPPRCPDPRWLDYWEGGKLGEYLERLLAVVGRDACFISVYDDLAADPAGQYRRLLDFLELPDAEPPSFKPHRVSMDVKIPWLQRLLKRPPKSALWLADKSYRERFEQGQPPNVSKRILNLRKRILEWNQRPAAPREIDTKLRSEMCAMYRDDNALLSKLVGRDLSHWLDS